MLEEDLKKESKIELEKIDCNCNECIYLLRNLEKYNYFVSKWKEIDIYNHNKQIERLKEKLERKDEKKKEGYLLELKKLTTGKLNHARPFVHYGKCLKLKKEISFIPGQCQIDTQECFKHRKDV